MMIVVNVWRWEHLQRCFHRITLLNIAMLTLLSPVILLYSFYISHNILLYNELDPVESYYN